MFQPLAFGPGEAEAVITGAVVSISAAYESDAELPALSTQLPVAVPLVLSRSLAKLLAAASTPDPPSVQM